MPAPAARKLSTAEARRSTVLASASRAFVERGYYVTTTLELRSTAGISQAYLFRLFPNEEALFVAVIERCTSPLRDRLSESVSR